MTDSAAFPFVLKRGSDVIDGLEIQSTVETVHGLIRLEGDRLTLQWRRSRKTDIVGFEIREEVEREPVRETSVPIAAVAGAAIRWRLWRWPPGPYLVLTAADLRAFDAISGESGLKLDHPALLEIRVRRADRAAAEEFAGELNLALAERALRAADARPQVSAGAHSNRLPEPRQDAIDRQADPRR